MHSHQEDEQRTRLRKAIDEIAPVTRGKVNVEMRGAITRDHKGHFTKNTTRPKRTNTGMRDPQRGYLREAEES